MQTVLIAGAGKSSIYLIEYLLQLSSRSKWHIIVADSDKDAALDKIGKHPNAEAVGLDISDAAQREPLVKKADLVISLMPPNLHMHLAKDCLKHKKNLITSSYISPEMAAMDKDVKAAGLMFMCEMGLDPGIDHMVSADIIRGIQIVASTINSYRSYCGGLTAPESDNNPWHYKFSWNTKNIVTAGQGGAKYLSQGKEVEVPYEEMFDGSRKIKINDLGSLCYYPNRDSVKYRDLYGIQEAKNVMRATLRHPAFCKGWDAIMKLGLVDAKDAFSTKEHTYATWLKMKTEHKTGTLYKHVAKKLGIPETDKVMGMLKWLGLFDELPLSGKKQSSADILHELLQNKWQMAPDDKDMVVMQHEVEYTHKGEKTKLTSTMVLKGENRKHSAMAKTVGLPIAILAKLVLTGKVKPPHGVHIPNMHSVYRGILVELKHYGIAFDEVME